MADGEAIKPIDSEDPDETPGYKAPAQKSLKEIQDQDQDDESLVKYKQTLLAGADEAASPKDDPRKVVVQKMVFVTEGRDDIALDLTGDVSQLKKTPITIKEGVEYRLRIIFKIQHEIVPGLRYHHVIKRGGINADKQTYMVGSYGPKGESQSYITPADEAPKGMMYRGNYEVKSKFLDDDHKVHLEWKWTLAIKKDWQ